MTTEDDFQAALDAHPEDWQTRLVFADWLEERDDPRAEGYRALGELRIHTLCNNLYPTWWNRSAEESSGSLPADWFAQIVEAGAYHELRCRMGTTQYVWVDFEARRAAEDAAALAFARLPAARRVELLAAAEVRA